MSNRSSVRNSHTNHRPLPMDANTWQRVADQLSLSDQQLRIVELILRGRRDKEIAEELGVSFHTVRAYLKRIFDRTDASDRLDLVLHVFALAQASSTKEV